MAWLIKSRFRGYRIVSGGRSIVLDSQLSREEHMVSLMARVLTVLVFTAAFSSPAVLFAQEGFFKGKTIRLIVGLAPGGGFDTYSRVIARHMGKHIPGTPAMVVDNMPGAAQQPRSREDQLERERPHQFPPRRI